MKRRSVYPVAGWIVWVAGVPLFLLGLGIALVATTSHEIPFDNADLWWLGGAVPLASLLCLYGFFRKRRAVERFFSPRLAPLLTSHAGSSRPAVRMGLILSALLMIVAAILGPRWGTFLEKRKVHGVDIVVALDVSRSMLARDVEPNRLENAKRILRQQLVERPVFRRANRLALIAFAGSTSLRVPLTSDHHNFRSKLQEVVVGSAPRGGTALAKAIQAATDLFESSPEGATKALFLLTDGDDHEGGAVELAREALTEHGIKTFTVGVGDATRSAGAQVPGAIEGRTQPMVHEGQIVFSKLDVQRLRDIALAGDGQYASLGDFHRLVEAIAKMWQSDLATEERQQYKPQYQWFVAAALLLLGLEALFGDPRVAMGQGVSRVWQQEVQA